MYKTVINGVMFNLSWLAIVMTQNNALALAIVALNLMLHFSYWHGGRAEVVLVVCVSLIGLLVDQLLFASGIMVRASGVHTAPLWLSCLWPVFATTLLHLFSFLQGRPVSAMLVGAIGGGASYLAGSKLSEVGFTSMPEGPVLLALLWALLLPLLLAMAAWLQRRDADG
jgi:hypothetical protein